MPFPPPRSAGALAALALVLAASRLSLPAAAAAPAPRQESPAAPRVAKGEQLLREDDPARALKEFEAALQVDPNLAAAHLGRVKALVATGDAKKALAAAEEGSDAVPENPALATALARVQLAAGNGIAAATSAARALALPSPPAEAWRIRAEAADLLDPEVPAGGVAAGEKLLGEALAKRPDDGELHSEVGGYLLQRGRGAAPVPFLVKAVAAAPGLLEPRLRLVRAYLLDRKIQEARDAALEAVAMAPGEADACIALGRTYEAAGEPAAALPHYESAVKLRPKRAAFQVDLGFCLAKLRKWKESEKALRTALKLEEGNLEARLHLGWVLNHEGDLAGALAEYVAILKVRPDDERALFNAGDISVLLGKSKEADRFLGRLLAVNPAHSEASRLLALMDFKAGRKDDAWKHLDACLGAEPKNARGLFLQGQLHDDDGNAEEAEKSWKAAAEADPKYAWPHLYLGELYDGPLAKPIDALNAFRLYIELGGPDPDGDIQRTIDALAKETGR